MSYKFNPSDAISSEFGIFGLPFTEEQAKVVLLPVPWEATTSYGRGASKGPEMVRSASEQIDLFDLETGKAYESGYFMREIPEWILQLNKEAKAKAQEVITMRLNLSEDTEKFERLTKDVNAASDRVSEWVHNQCLEILSKGKWLGLVGGDHSTPFGCIQAVSDFYKGDVGILHIDAHADLRNSYQGFTQSHASIMHNVINKINIKKLVQVGIRDFCEEEYDLIQSKKGQIRTFFDMELKKRLLEGDSWKKICEDIVAELPQNVYISFDIDGLDPAFCPHTGTPVPGGMTPDQIFYLFNAIYSAGKNIVAFDLNEVSDGDTEEAEWDGNVGARMLYKLCGWLVKSHERMSR
ncbi:MAG: agmatinase family protein [Pseudobdellovibrionaceae bacterium]